MKKALPLIAVLLMSGCVSSGRDYDDTSVTKIQKGVTTEQQVVELMGKPISVTTTANGNKMLMYMHTTAKANAASYIPVVGLMAGGATGNTKMLMITIGPDGKVLDYTNNNTSTEVKTGLIN